jgi:Mg-chelatase subunit ChlD
MKILIPIFFLLWVKQLLLVNGQNKCNLILDLTFLIDSSGSLTPNEFIQEKIFVDRIVRRLNVEAKVREAYIGLISFSEVPYTYQIYVPNTQFIDMVSNRVKSLPYMGRSTALASALRDARMNVFREIRGVTTPRIAVLISDGSGNETPDEIKLEAKLLKDNHVHLFVVGVGKNVKNETLNAIASQSTSFYINDINDFHSVLKSINRVTQDSCGINGLV